MKPAAINAVSSCVPQKSFRLTAFNLVMITVERNVSSMVVADCGEETEFSREQKYKSRNEASKQMTDCNSIGKVYQKI